MTCLTLGEETEWVEAGWNALVDRAPDRTRQTALDLPALSLNPVPLPPTSPVPLTPTSSPYGDGRAAERMIGILVEYKRVRYGSA